MSTYVKTNLSGSVNGKGIAISGSTTANGVTVHTATSGSGNWDEVWLWAVNSGSSVSAKLTVEWGETTAPDGNIEVYVPAESGLLLVAPGLLIQNSLLIKAFANPAGAVILHGFVNRISP